MEMDKNNIEKLVREVIAEKLDLKKEEIKSDSVLTDDLGMDSLGAIELGFEIEEKFGFDFPEQDMADIKTIQDIVDYVVRRLQKKEGNIKEIA